MTRWHYHILSQFNRDYYKDLLTTNMIDGGEQAMKMPSDTITPYGEAELETHYFYPLKKNHRLYAFPSQCLKDLPILATKTFKKSHSGGKVFNIITSYSSAKFKPQKRMTFKELVDKFCDFSHSSPQDFLLWKIIVLTSYLGRANIRVSSPPNFGKDSVGKAINSLFSNLAIIQNPTIAKLEYLLTNKVVFLNEVTNINPSERRDIEQFLLSTGDFSNIYEKRSRARTENQETYDISELSLILAYNNIDCYPDKTKYFDKLFQRAVHNRFLPLKLRGTLTEKFGHLDNAKELAKTYKDFFVDFVRTIEYYKNNWQKESAGINYTEPLHDLKGRWKHNYDALKTFIGLYSENQREYEDLLSLLMTRHKDYMRMIQPKKEGLNDWDESMVTEERLGE